MKNIWACLLLMHFSCPYEPSTNWFLKIDVGTQIFVGPGVLPSGLPNDTTPPRILEALRAGNSMESARTQVAATSEYKLQVETTS